MPSTKQITCKTCNQTKTHQAKGFCVSCYYKEYNKTRKESLREYYRAYWIRNRPPGRPTRKRCTKQAKADIMEEADQPTEYTARQQ